MLTGTDNVGNTVSITDRRQGRHQRPGRAWPGARRLQRRCSHHRHDGLLPPRRQRLLRRHRLARPTGSPGSSTTPSRLSPASPAPAPVRLAPTRWRRRPSRTAPSRSPRATRPCSAPRRPTSRSPPTLLRRPAARSPSTPSPPRGGGTQSYDGDGTFTIGTRTDYTDATSGIASSTLTREQGTLNADACSAYGAPTTLVGTPAQSGLATGCYRYVLTGTDNVGNTISITTVVKVDTSAPAAPGLVLADSSADVHTTGTTAFYRPAGTGSFDVTASSTDGAVRDPRLHLPRPRRLHRLRRRRHPHLHPGHADRAQRRQARHRPQPGPAHLGAPPTSPSPPTRPCPTGGALTVNTVAASGGGSQSYDNDGTFTIGAPHRLHATRSPASTSSTLTREQGTLNADACSAYGAPTTLVGTPAQTASRPVATATSSPAPTTSATLRRSPPSSRSTPSDPTAPCALARRLERRRPHHRHHRLLPPRRHGLLRRHCLLHRRPVRHRLDYTFPDPRRLHRLRRRRAPAPTPSPPRPSPTAPRRSPRTTTPARTNSSTFTLTSDSAAPDRRRADGERRRR